jgi:hypothetical protein
MHANIGHATPEFKAKTATVRSGASHVFAAAPMPAKMPLCAGSVYNLVSKVSFSARHLIYCLFCCLTQQAANQDVGSVYAF